MPAHVIPFSKRQNDHSANGLALCKNHHWHVSKILDPRCSNGVKELLELSGISLLLPQNEAFQMDAVELKWKSERLIA